MSYTLAVGRPESEWRRAVVAGDRGEAIERLRKGTGKGVWSSSERAVNRPVAFVLAGVGEQAAGAGRDLYEGEPAFRDAADRCAEILQPLMGLDIRESMFAGAHSRRATGCAAVAGCSRRPGWRSRRRSSWTGRWRRCGMSWGIRPAAVLGYSVGEYAAAALAGVLRLEDALVMVARRAEWIEAMAEPGVMLAVPLTEAEIRPRLGEELWVAAVNSPQATVIGGREEAIGRLEEELRKAEVATRRVASDQGSHTPLLDPVRPHLKQLAEGMRREPPGSRCCPMSRGHGCPQRSAQDATTGASTCAAPCGSSRGSASCCGTRNRILLEVGPGSGAERNGAATSPVRP